MLKTKILRDLGVASMLCLVVGCSEDLAKCSGVDGEMTFSTAYFADSKPKEGFGYVHLKDYSHYDFIIQQVLDDNAVVVSADTDMNDRMLLNMTSGNSWQTAGAVNHIRKKAQKNKGALIYTKRVYGDGEKLDFGVYVYRGREKFELQDGGSVVMKVFAEVSTNRAIGLIADYKELLGKKDTVKKSTAIAANKVAIENEKTAAIDVDVPIKSICGFVLGSTPAQNWELFKKNESKQYSYKRGDLKGLMRGALLDPFDGTLVKPFRHFTNAEIDFTFVEGIQEHLYKVNLYSDEINIGEIQPSSIEEELTSVKKMLEERFGISLAEYNKRNGFSWKWQCVDKNGRGVESLALYYTGAECGVIRYNGKFCLDLYCGRVEEIDEAAKEAKKKSLKLSGKEGADVL